MRESLDSIDMELLKLLSKNARTTHRELSKALGTTRQRVSRRIERLEKLGVIKKYTILPDYDALGYVRIILGIKLKAEADMEAMLNHLGKLEEIKILERGLGTYDIIAHVICNSDIRELESKLRKISKIIPGIERIDVTIVTDVIKFDTL